MVKELTDTTFSAEVEQGKGIALVDFWAPWCGPCRLLAPTIEQLAEEYQGQVRFYKLNVDQSPATASRFGVMSIPTIFLFADGKPLGYLVGVQPKHALESTLDKILSEQPNLKV